MARAEALAADIERLHKAMPPGPYEADWCIIFAHHEDGERIECETPDQAKGFAGLHRAALEVAAVLRGLVADLRALQDELDHIAPASERDWLSRASRRFCETLMSDRAAARLRVRKLERELASLRAQVVSALSAAGPSEDERTA
jgi:hypothetical protein